ncbi:MAG: glycosyltransferase family 39 protein [Armatimonadota bacterium]
MRWTLWLWAFVVVVRVGYALLAVQIDPFLRRDPLHGDAAVHDRIAWTLVSEGRYVYEKGLQVAPAYIWLMAGVYALVGHQPQAVRLVNALLGLLALAGLWIMSRRLFGERVANWTLLLAALHPHLLMITGWLYTENLMLPLLVWAITLSVLAVSNESNGAGWRWGLVGGLLGLLTLTRASFLPFILLVALWAWRFSARPAVPLSRSVGEGLGVRASVRLPRCRGFCAFALILLIACLVITPYVLYLHARFGRFIPIGLGGYVFLWANNPEADGGFKPGLPETIRIGGREVNVRQAIASPDLVERDRKALRLALQWIRENPSAFARLLWLKTRLSLAAFGLQDPGNRRLAAVLRGADILYWLYLLIALYGFVSMGRAVASRTDPIASSSESISEHIHHFATSPLRHFTTSPFRHFAISPFLWLLLLLAGWVWLMIWVYAGGSRPMLPLQPYLVPGFVWGCQTLMSQIGQRRRAAPR